MGFSSNGYSLVDNLKIKSWDGDGFDVIEHYDDFTMNGSNYVEETLMYDAVGNLTYDGGQQYAYDAWNRLVSVAHAYRDGSGVQAGQVFAKYTYDGLGRRIKQEITGTGDLDHVEHY